MPIRASHGCVVDFRLLGIECGNGVGKLSEALGRGANALDMSNAMTAIADDFGADDIVVVDDKREVAFASCFKEECRPRLTTTV